MGERAMSMGITASSSSLSFAWEEGAHEGGCWSQDDDEITAQYRVQLSGLKDRDSISQMSCESTDSREPVFIQAGDIRRRLSESLTTDSYCLAHQRILDLRVHPSN